MTMMAPLPAHPRILLVEDDPLIAMALADMLEAADFEVDGPYPSLSDGVAAVADHMPDAAVLDVQLGDRDVFLLADDLEQYGIPFVLCSGRTPGGRIASLSDNHPFVGKDRANRDLVAALEEALRQAH